MIFVFGSNLAGIHGAGSALTAASTLAFPYGLGVGIGPNNLAYALPTKDCQLKVIPLKVIRLYVDQFVHYAEMERVNSFKVTQIGCGHAGYTPKEIAPLFKLAPPNCLFDEEWSPWLPIGTKFWGTYTQRDMQKEAAVTYSPRGPIV